MRRLSDLKLYAVKEINVHSMNTRDREDQLNEIRIIASIYHPNILAYYEAFIENGKMYIVTDYADLGDLDSEIAQHIKQKKRFTEEQAWQILLQCLNGLRALHARGIMHRDVKGQNILKYTNTEDAMGAPIYKLADFGVSKVIHSQHDLGKTGIGTPYYISPEIWKNTQYNEKTDVFSLGCMLYEICTLRHPYEGKDMKDLARNVLKGQFIPVSESFTVDLRSVIYRMMCQDPVKRPTVQQILELPFISQYEKYCPTKIEKYDDFLGQNTMVMAGFEWKNPNLMKTIGITQAVTSAMNGQNVVAEQINKNVLPGSEYKKREEFEILNKVHQKRVTDSLESDFARVDIEDLKVVKSDSEAINTKADSKCSQFARPQVQVLLKQNQQYSNIMPSQVSNQQQNELNKKNYQLAKIQPITAQHLFSGINAVEYSKKPQRIFLQQQCGLMSKNQKYEQEGHKQTQVCRSVQ